MCKYLRGQIIHDSAYRNVQTQHVSTRSISLANVLEDNDYYADDILKMCKHTGPLFDHMKPLILVVGWSD